MLLPVWFTRIIATSSHALPGARRRAGSPWTDAPWPSTTLRDWASRMPSCHRAVSVGHVAVCCQCSSMTSKYSVLASRRSSSNFCRGSTPSRVVTFDMIWYVSRGMPFKRDAEHPVHLAVGFRCLEEADAAVVGMAHEPREAFLPEVTLDAPAEAAGAERQPRDLHARSSERHLVGRPPESGTDRSRPGHGQRARGQAGLQERASREVRHR